MKKQTNLSEMTSINVAIGLVMALFLAACGGDSSSSGPSDNATSESDIIEAAFDDLPVCTSKREGVTAYVKDEKIAYICIDEDWILDGDESPSSSVSQSDNDESSSSVDKTKSSSSRHCEDCKDDAIFSSSTDKVISSSSSSSTNEQNSSTSEQLNIVVIKDKSYTGVSQKGPFVTGSAVKLYELDGKTYAQTGKSFTGKITTDDGKFSISSVTLASQYALLEANGYYRNEITGDKSKGPVSLNAFTDLSDRKTVNVNLLTHLEYERALHLVGIGVEVSSAKKQAEAEILNAFGIKGDFASSEDLDIFSNGDGNAALLAFSVLMLRDLSEADLTELLTKFATDIESDGSWDDEATKAKIADWAQIMDLSGKLAFIRSNIEKWNLGTVPEFEKYVRNFWYKNYGLGECGANNKAEVLAAKNERCAKYGTQTRYICKDGAWVEASDIEKDTYKWEAGEDGEIKTGNVTLTKKYDYDGKLKKWRDATTIESELGGCTEAREIDINLNTGRVNGLWYICKNREWNSTDNITVDTQGWINGFDGDLRKGDSTEVFYKYDEAQNKWLTATHNDTALKLMGCTTNRSGEVGKSSTNDTYYVCKNLHWMMAQEIDYDTYGERCSNNDVGKTISGVVTATNKYYCSVNGWVSLMGNWSWNVPKEGRLNPDITYDVMTDNRDKKVYKTIKIGNQVWMAENLNYADSSATPSLKGKSWCYDNKAEYCSIAGRFYTWAAAIDSAKLYKDKSIECGYGKTCTLPDTVYGICPPGWHLPANSEWETLFAEVGGISTAGMILKSRTGWYNGGNGTDGVGFSVLPAGFIGRDGKGYFDAGKHINFWSATMGSSTAYIVSLDYSYDDVALSVELRNYGFSVRCIQD